MSFIVKYKDNKEQAVDFTGRITLDTKGKYCEDDIIIKNTEFSELYTKESKINFWDYNGALIYDGTTGYPALLPHTFKISNNAFLTPSFQWNWDIAQIEQILEKDHFYKRVDIGIERLPNNEGKDYITFLYITIPGARRDIRLALGVNGKVSVYWGDGTDESIQGESTSSPVSLSHTYSSPGNYVIGVAVSSGTVFSFLGSAGGSYVLQYGGEDGGLDDQRNQLARNCLNRVILGKGARVQTYGFYKCENLKTVLVSSDTALVEGNNFYSCWPLQFFTFPSSCTNLPPYCLANDRALRQVSIGPAVTAISSGVFYGCYSLTSLGFPSTVNYIGANAFNNCFGMRVYDFSSCTAVPTLANANAFTGISSDCKIYVPNSLLLQWKTSTNWTAVANYIEGV